MTARLVVVGPGLMGLKHIELIRANPRCALAGVVYPVAHREPDVLRRLDAPVFDDLETCFAAGAPDGVIIASPNPWHGDQARFCIDRDVAVLIEKPITDDVSDGQRLCDLAEQRRARVLVGHHRAHSPIVQTAVEVARSGRLGRIVGFQGSAAFYKPVEYFAAGPWRSQPGGGPVLINLIHEIGLMRAFCGEISGVHALASHAVRQSAVEDTVVINLQFASGALGAFLLSDTAASASSWEQTSGENPAFAAYPGEACYTLFGTRGALAIPTLDLKAHPPETPSSWLTPMTQERLAVDRLDPLTRQLDHFLDVLQHGAAPLVSARDGLANLIVTDAIRRSVATGRFTPLAA